MVDIDELVSQVRQQCGWESPTSRDQSSVSWSYVDGVGQRHIVAAWQGEEMERVENFTTGESTMVPTGRRGIMVSGRQSVCVTLDEAVTALDTAARRQYEPELLKMFRLRREWGMIGMPVVPLDQVFVYNDYGDAIRAASYY